MRTFGQPPPPASIVVREGRAKAIMDVMEEADDDRLERQDDGSWNGIYHLSVFAGPAETGETLDDTITRLFGEHRKVKWYRIAQLEILDGQDFRLGASPPEPYHYEVILGENLTHSIVEAFEKCFGEERRNSRWQRS